MYPLRRPSNYTIYGKLPGTAWRSAVSYIDSHGVKIQDEHGAWTREVENLQIVVESPLEGWPLEGSGWSLTALDAYAKQFFSPDPGGHDYTYGERMYQVFKSLGKEIEDVCDGEEEQNVYNRYWQQLRNKIIGAAEVDMLNSRRFCIPVLRAADLMKKNAPCMVAVSFLIRDNKINATAFFRSHDIQRAWPANVYGLSKLMDHLAVAARSKFAVGRITTYSVSAHIYI